jgi:hypothetical protein
VGSLQAGVIPAVSVIGRATGQSSGDTTVGFSFSTNNAFSIDALGAYGPVTGGTTVRLYDSGQNVLATTVVTTADVQGDTFFGESFYFHFITPVSLAAGQTYYIVEDLPPHTNWLGNGGADSITTDPAINFLGGVAQLGEGGFPTTDTIFHGTINPAYFGPDFEIEAVPEPATLALAATGAACLMGYGWRRRRRTEGTQRE